MTYIANRQLSLIAESDFTYSPVGDWEYDELGTDIYLDPNSHNQKLGTENLLVPNSPDKKLGTENLLVPNSPDKKLGTENLLVPNSENRELWTDNLLVPNFEGWQPPIGCLEQKPIKEHKYWYWRYYDNSGKKASLYLAKDYNKAVARAMSIGIPPNAKQAKNTLQSTNPQTSTATNQNIIDITSTAYPAPRAA